MNKLVKFFLVILAIFTLSVVLTPLFYSVLHPYFKFEKIFDRLVMVFAIMAAVLFVVVPKVRKTGVRGLFDPELWRAYGFDFSKPWQRLLVYGFLAGALTVSLMALVEVIFGPRYLRQPISLQDIIERFFKGFLSGSIIGFVEEFFFRGFIFTQLKQKMNSGIAVVLASAFYSLCHFFDNGQIFMPEHPSFHDAGRLFVGVLEPILRHPNDILPPFIGLFLFGIVLNIAFIRTRSLFCSIGIHAGAVFLIKFQYSFVRIDLETYHAFFGTSPYYDGPVEWLILILLGFVIWFGTKRTQELS